MPDEGEALDGAVTDVEKLVHLWGKMEVGDVDCQHRRLGTAGGGGRKRPLLLTIRDKDTRLRILANSKKLKTAGENYTRIYVKKDVLPSVRKEWKRLRDAEAREKEKPENVGCVSDWTQDKGNCTEMMTSLIVRTHSFFLEIPVCQGN